MTTTYKIFGVPIFKKILKDSWQGYEPTTTDYIVFGIKVVSKIIS